tara:strand:- start:33 stop:254 length:222 start_codon:yes stop_codon:yes gene_type:complete
MKEAIEYLIEQYKQKEKDCDTLLSVIAKRITEYRRSGDEISIQTQRREQAILFAQRQAYVQARADIDSLIDYL